MSKRADEKAEKFLAEVKKMFQAHADRFTAEGDEHAAQNALAAYEVAEHECAVFTRFTHETKVPLTALTFLGKLKHRYECGPRWFLDGPQRVMLALYDTLNPIRKTELLLEAAEEGRDYLRGKEVINVYLESEGI